MALTRVRTVFTGVPGTPWMSNMYFDVEAAEAQLAVDAVGAFWGEVDAVISASVDWAIEPFVTVLDPVTGQPTGVVAVEAFSGSGGSAGDMVPRAAQALISWDTGVWQAGRQIRGKTFIPGIGETRSSVDGALSTELIAALALAASNLIVTPGNPTLNVYSRKNGTMVPVSAGAVSNQWAVLRSRRD